MRSAYPVIDPIQQEATARNVKVTILVDFVHVLEYLWSACWFAGASSRKVTQPPRPGCTRKRAVLEGNASTVAAAIRCKAIRLGLDADKHANADRAADYLHNKAPYLDYPTALKQGWPIATGVIKGACRHSVKDQMDITGARWGSKAPRPS